jgi:hypothetical protein
VLINIHVWSFLTQFFLEWNVSDKFVEEIKTLFVYSTTFFSNRAVYEIILKKIVERGTLQMTTLRMRISCWITKATGTLTVCSTAFPRTRLIFTLCVHCVSCYEFHFTDLNINMLCRKHVVTIQYTVWYTYTPVVFHSMYSFYYCNQRNGMTVIANVKVYEVLDSSWNVMTYGEAPEGKWRGNWRMEWVASTLHTTSELGVSSITTADAHTSAVSSRLNWHPRRFKWTRPFRRKTNSGLCACAITFQTQSTMNSWDWCALGGHC